MSTRRQALSRLSAAAAVTAFPGLVAAQSDWPNKPIRLIASSSPGSSTDVVSRLIADGLSQRLGQPVVVE
ncbi:MAG TPA: tripartite tricarboxylate transporter substrate binding protein, partial [Ramlibacter sp.]|nr:tripartite tricarboxylate transporter substrate binding protein [Ramlibacter sp.]